MSVRNRHAGEPPALAGTGYSAVCTVIHGTSAGNDINREPGTGDGKPGYRADKSPAGIYEITSELHHGKSAPPKTTLDYHVLVIFVVLIFASADHQGAKIREWNFRDLYNIIMI